MLGQVTRTESISASYITLTLELYSAKHFQFTFKHSDYPYTICALKDRPLDYLKNM